MSTIEDQIIAIVQQEFGLEPGGVGLASPLADLGDSLDWVNLLSALEAAFDLRISIDEGLSLTTVGDLVRLAQTCAPAAKEPVRA